MTRYVPTQTPQSDEKRVYDLRKRRPQIKIMLSMSGHKAHKPHKFFKKVVIRIQPIAMMASTTIPLVNEIRFASLEAVNKMQRNNFKHANDLLCECLRRLRDESDDYQPTPIRRGIQEASPQDCDNNNNNNVLSSQEYVQTAPLSDLQGLDSTDNGFEVFNRAVLLTEKAGEDFTPAKFLDGMGAVLLYNLALSEHMRGLKVKGSRVGLFQRALHYYQLCFATLRQGSSTDVMAVLLLAVVNNMGHIHSTSSFKSEQSIKCREYFSRLLASIAQKSTDMSRMLSEDDLAFFSMQGLFFSTITTQSAPAA